MHCDETLYTVANESKTGSDCTSTTDPTVQTTVTHRRVISTKPTTDLTAFNGTTMSPPSEPNDTALMRA